MDTCLEREEVQVEELKKIVLIYLTFYKTLN